KLRECYVYNNQLDFEALDNANIDWAGNSYFKYSDQNLILPILQSNDGTDYTFEVDYVYAGITYQWYKNDVLIDSETNQSLSFPISELGYYYCLVNYASLPDLTLQSETISISTVGIEKPGTFVSKVFPNPTREYLKIQLEKPLENNAFLQLKNITGNTVLSQSVGNKTQIELQLKGISKGIYFLQISNGEDTFVQKIIIE
ncbi:MAG: T9SS type A sorting domain-containing protein, partial [Bacteroidales bacterium]|nr:T9SS type A sorting domain-containing protein [Bacteroidales bacterium]